ncbi:hypothetical protein [Winogradskyella schleiferi]|uniref:hypothetical protein n=1 Tax=Winogradskyella schleiferi TaxID=2686078 RepID=UPI0015C196C8|nr:hypothetical protein [Winogradskyella schleiferi]
MDELNWITIGVTSLTSFVAAFFFGTYISFKFSKKQKIFENKLEVEARLINELKIPIYEMEKNISDFQLYIKNEGVDKIVEGIFEGNEVFINIAQEIYDTSNKVNYILDLNSFYINKNQRDIIVTETIKARQVGFISAFLKIKNFQEVYKKSTIKESLESSEEILKGYDSKALHNALPKIIKSK